MIKTSAIALALVIATPMMAPVAFAQGAPQTIVNYKVDVTRVATGYRVTKLVGTAVVNEAKETIGKIDDLIVNRDDRVLYAIVSVGGFLGIGDKLVAVPSESLQITPDKILLPGATKDALKALPVFEYAKK